MHKRITNHIVTRYSTLVCGCIICLIDSEVTEDQHIMYMCDGGYEDGFLPIAHWLIDLDV